MMYRTQRANSATPIRTRSWYLQYLIYIAVGNLTASILFNPGAPARAYEGFFEMFGHAAQSLQQATSPSDDSGPIGADGQPRTAENPWQAYAPDRVITAEEWTHFSRLSLPQRRDTLGKVIGAPRQVNYSSVDAYEEHQRYDGRPIEITYRNGTDQRGNAGWIAVSVEVK
jgi:hypothetical protein